MLGMLYVFPQNSPVKPPLDLQTYKTWSSIGYGKISDDGKYVIYDIDNEPAGSRTYIVKAMDNSWEKKYIGALAARFDEHRGLAIIEQSDP
jgi:hypothetical protein